MASSSPAPRTLGALLDAWVPIIACSETQDDPFAAGRALYTQPSRLGSYRMVDSRSGRRTLRH